MKSMQHKQTGGSTFGTIVFLVVLVYAIFVGIQFAPQWIESRAVQSILDDMRDQQLSDPVDSAASARSKAIRMLQINEMNDMIENMSVESRNGRYQVTFRYQRELNLIYEKRVMRYEKSATL